MCKLATSKFVLLKGKTFVPNIACSNHNMSIVNWWCQIIEEALGLTSSFFSDAVSNVEGQPWALSNWKESYVKGMHELS